MDSIEFALPQSGRCACCGSAQTVLTRYVTRDEDAFAVYRAVLTEGHGRPRAQLLVGFGDWSENAAPSARVAIAFDLWIDDHNTNVTILGREETPWASGHLGILLDREPALAHPLAAEVFALSEHILRCDEPIADYLGHHRT